MKKIIIAIVFMFALPIVASAEQTAKPAEKEHHMQNAAPSSTEVVEQAPEHTMNNSNPSPKQDNKSEKKHTMKNN